MLAIVDYARPNLSRPPSFDYLAFNAGMTVPVFKDHVLEMQGRGWLTVSGPDQAVTIEMDGLMREIERLSDDGSRESEADTHAQEGPPI